MGTNPPMTEVTNPPITVPPVVTNPPVIVAPIEPVMPVAGAEYVVVKGDSLAKIAKKSGVTLKALQAANLGVIPTKLKIGQKLVLPAGGKTSADAGLSPTATVGGESTTSYT